MFSKLTSWLAVVCIAAIAAVFGVSVAAARTLKLPPINSATVACHSEQQFVPKIRAIRIGTRITPVTVYLGSCNATPAAAIFRWIAYSHNRQVASRTIRIGASGKVKILQDTGIGYGQWLSR